MRTIDAHHHLWHYTPDEFDWLGGPLAPLRRDFLAGDLALAMQSAGIDGAIAVQARQTLAETHWLLKTAAHTAHIPGVVGWAPIASEHFPDTLAQLATEPKLKGLRHVVQGEPDPDFLLRPAFERGIRALLPTGLVYDLLVLESQLPQAIRFVDRHPNQVFVLDHLAKPKIAAGELEPWATHLGELARREHVFCKLSGMVTEADPRHWSPAQFLPYLDAALAAFGPHRLIAGSDWPVCLAGVSYAAWFHLLRDYFAPASEAEREAVFGATATRVYHLDPEETPC